MVSHCLQTLACGSSRNIKNDNDICIHLCISCRGYRETCWFMFTLNVTVSFAFDCYDPYDLIRHRLLMEFPMQQQFSLM